eukprot:scaffold49788_cov18-Prasinocladus_malaysianus.AAC.2
MEWNGMESLHRRVHMRASWTSAIRSGDLRRRGSSPVYLALSLFPPFFLAILQVSTGLHPPEGLSQASHPGVPMPLYVPFM